MRRWLLLCGLLLSALAQAQTVQMTLSDLGAAYEENGQSTPDDYLSKTMRISAIYVETMEGITGDTLISLVDENGEYEARATLAAGQSADFEPGEELELTCIIGFSMGAWIALQDCTR